MDGQDRAQSFRELKEKEGHFLDNLFKLEVISFNPFENSINVVVRKEKSPEIEFDFNLRLFEKKQEGQKRLLEHYEINTESDVKINLVFQGITFKSDVFSNQIIEANLTFENCFFEKTLILKGIKLTGKLRFRECTFRHLDFSNTIFSDLLDFWHCTFYEAIIFYKTDFLGTTSFAASTFEKNVLFTYSLINKRLIFRGTLFVQGLDLSVALKSGDLDLFDLELSNYPSKDLNPKFLDHKKEYEECITKTAQIPTKNKRETFRYLKNMLVSQSNVYESVNYKVTEKSILLGEVWIQFLREMRTSTLTIPDVNMILKTISDLFSLGLNWLSNRHGRSFLSAFLFTALFGWLFFYFSLVLGTREYIFSLNPTEWTYREDFQYYIEFLIPTHPFDYFRDGVTKNSCFYFFDFFGRIFVSYGIYQFIQAFRKFR